MLTVIERTQHSDDISMFDYLLSDGSVVTLQGFCGSGFYYDLASKLLALDVRTCACQIGYERYHEINNDGDRCMLEI